MARFSKVGTSRLPSLLGLALVACVMPPLAVLIRIGCHLQLFLNIILTLIFWVPGVIHALIIIVTGIGYKRGSLGHGYEKRVVRDEKLM